MASVQDALQLSTTLADPLARRCSSELSSSESEFPLQPLASTRSQRLCALSTQPLPHLSPLTLALSQPRFRARSHPHFYQAQSSLKAHGALSTSAPFSTEAYYRQHKVDFNDLPKEYIQAIQQDLLSLMHKRPEVLGAVKEFMQAVDDNGALALSFMSMTRRASSLTVYVCYCVRAYMYIRLGSRHRLSGAVQAKGHDPFEAPEAEGFCRNRGEDVRGTARRRRRHLV